MKRCVGRQESSLSIAMSPENSVPEFVRDVDGFARSGDIRIVVTIGPSPMFVWDDAIAFGLMVDTSLTGNERTMWEVHSTVGFSTSASYGLVPDFADEICEPGALIPGRRYFVSVYGTYPRYGIQEFEY
jgi:hypothetical protein